VGEFRDAKIRDLATTVSNPIARDPSSGTPLNANTAFISQAELDHALSTAKATKEKIKAIKEKKGEYKNANPTYTRLLDVTITPLESQLTSSTPHLDKVQHQNIQDQALLANLTISPKTRIILEAKDMSTIGADLTREGVTDQTVDYAVMKAEIEEKIKYIRAAQDRVAAVGDGSPPEIRVKETHDDLEKQIALLTKLAAHPGININASPDSLVLKALPPRLSDQTTLLKAHSKLHKSVQEPIKNLLDDYIALEKIILNAQGSVVKKDDAGEPTESLLDLKHQVIAAHDTGTPYIQTKINEAKARLAFLAEDDNPANPSTDLKNNVNLAESLGRAEIDYLKKIIPELESLKATGERVYAEQMQKSEQTHVRRPFETPRVQLKDQEEANDFVKKSWSY